MKSIVSLILYLLLFNLVVFPQEAEELSILEGTVMTSSDNFGSLLVPNSTIELINQNTKETYVVTTDEVGRYKINLPFGNYEGKAKTKWHCTQTRAPFEIKAGKRLQVNFYLFADATSTNLVVEDGKSRLEVEQFCPFRRETIDLTKNSQGAGEQAVIQFVAKKFLDKFAVYSGMESSAGHVSIPVLMSFNTTQVSASKIIRMQDDVFEASGNVILEDGVNSSSYERVRFAFDGKVLSIHWYVGNTIEDPLGSGSRVIL